MFHQPHKLEPSSSPISLHRLVPPRERVLAIAWAALLGCTAQPTPGPDERHISFRPHESTAAIDSDQVASLILDATHNWTEGEAVGGWVAHGDLAARHRDHSEPGYADFVFGRKPATLRIRPPRGLVEFEVMGGDMVYADKSLAIAVASQPALQLPHIEHLAAGEFAVLRWTMQIDGDFEDFIFSAPGGGTWVLSSIRMRTTQTPIEPSAARIRPRPSKTQSKWKDATALPLPPVLMRPATSSQVVEPPKRVEKAEYLAAIHTIAARYLGAQAPDGRVIDPDEDKEIQYATPAFGWIAALLAHESSQPTWQAPAEKAIDRSIEALVARNAPSGHEDFYPIMIAHAWRWAFDSQRAAAQKQVIAASDPWKLYTTPPGLGNWNVAALAGEYRFSQLDLRSDLSFVEVSLSRQSQHMNNAFGHYLSEENAVAYDILPRIWLGDLLQAGYNGEDADALAEVWDRAAWFTLLAQSPRGEMLSGGRSSLYVWNDAALCALFEIAATRAQSKGDAEKAGYYRAGAHLALSSLLQWFNQDGTLAIAKNHSSLHSRHGLEPYAHASNYNLLTAALLALAYEHFDTSVLERRAPSQTKNIYLDTRETLGKIAANLHGTAIEINVRKNDSNDPVGLTRIDWNLADQRIIVPAGLLDKPPYGAPRPSTGATRASIGVSVQWHAQGESWQNLSSAQSQNGDAHAPLSIEQVQANEHHIEVQTYYHHLQNDVGVFETYDIEENAVRVTSRVDSAESRGIRMVAPILVDDGEVKLSPVHDANGCIQIVAPPSSSAAHRRATWCTNAGSLRLLPDKFTYRSGWAQLLVTDEQSSTQAIWLELRGGELP